MYLLPPFILQNLKTIFGVDPDLWGCAIFGPKTAYLSWTNFFWYNYYFHLPIAHFIAQFFKKILTADQEIWGCTIFGPKMAHLPKLEFLRKPVNEPFFFHSCLSICQKPKSDINLLVKYWQLKNTEISLANSHFWL